MSDGAPSGRSARAPQLRVIERPPHVDAPPGRIQAQSKVPFHRELTKDGQRIVMDLFYDEDGDRIVQRGVNMTTGKVLWFSFDLDDQSEALP